MNIYAERPWWLIISGVLIVAIFLVWFLLPQCPISISFDEMPLSRGVNHIMWVTVRNPLNFPAKHVVIYVRPRSEGILLDKNIFEIPELYPGDQKTLTIPFFVAGDALPGTHTIEVFVAFPGRTWKETARVEVT